MLGEEYYCYFPNMRGVQCESVVELPFGGHGDMVYFGALRLLQVSDSGVIFGILVGSPLSTGPSAVCSGPEAILLKRR